MKSTIVITGRVCLLDEDSIDNELLGDEVEPKKFVAWRKMCIPISITTKVTQYDETRSMIHTSLFGDILVKEKFEKLQPRWSELSDAYEEMASKNQEYFDSADNINGFIIDDTDEDEK